MDTQEQDQANGHREPRTIRVQLNTGLPFDMPAQMAVRLIQNVAKDRPELVGKHLAELMGVGKRANGTP